MTLLIMDVPFFSLWLFTGPAVEGRNTALVDELAGIAESVGLSGDKAR
ncbi:MAG: hypothetical protein R2940_15420 [Syntrophotaleaceae bacterium]